MFEENKHHCNDKLNPEMNKGGGGGKGTPKSKEDENSSYWVECDRCQHWCIIDYPSYIKLKGTVPKF